jgi:hypothetical protein
MIFRIGRGAPPGPIIAWSVIVNITELIAEGFTVLPFHQSANVTSMVKGTGTALPSRVAG